MKRQIAGCVGLFLALVLVLPGCSDAYRANLGSVGSKHKITLYSGGREVRNWTSSGTIVNEENSDGWYFKDDVSGNLIRVTGEVVVEQL